MTIDADLEALLEPVAVGLGFELVRVVVSKVAGAQTLQILAERPEGGMSIDDCAKLSRAFAAVLDEKDPLKDPYMLEVGSPGLDRPLVRLRDYERFSGREIRIEIKAGVAGQKRFKGVLLGLQDGKIALKLAEGDAPPSFDVAAPLLMDLAEIVKAKLIVSDAVLKADFAKAALLAEVPGGDDFLAENDDAVQSDNELTENPAPRDGRSGQKQKRSG